MLTSLATHGRTIHGSKTSAECASLVQADPVINRCSCASSERFSAALWYRRLRPAPWSRRHRNGWHRWWALRCPCPFPPALPSWLSLNSLRKMMLYASRAYGDTKQVWTLLRHQILKPCASRWTLLAGPRPRRWQGTAYRLRAPTRISAASARGGAAETQPARSSPRRT